MLLRGSGFPLWVSCGFLLVGCDPVRTTLQPVRLRIANSASGKPISGAQVSLKPDLDRGTLIKKEGQRLQEWNAWPGFSGVSDIHGQAIIDIKWTVIDRSIGATPPAWRDWVTGHLYQVIATKDQASEESSLVMRPGEFVHGQTFTVSVLEIEHPRYVKTGQHVPEHQETK